MGVFCLCRKVDPFQPPLASLLDFLLLEFRKRKGRRYSSMNTIRSVISAMAWIVDRLAGQHPLVRRFLMSVFQKRRSLSQRLTTWDPAVVLTYIRSLGPNSTLSNIQLSRKFRVLMVLLSGQRGQTLHLLDIRNMAFSDSKVSFRIGDPLKTSRPGSHLAKLCLGLTS